MVLRWKMFKEVITKEGAFLRGDVVKTWLKDRKYKVGDGTEATIDMGGDVTLRTQAEFRGLLEFLECRKIVFLGGATPSPSGRTAARGKSSQNTNTGILRLEFLNAANDSAITSLSLDHGKTKRIKVRLTPAPACDAMTLELSWIGAKLRTRDAIRSMISPSSGYRYLSRVRVAYHADGIQQPLSDLTKKFATKAIAKRSKIDRSTILAEVTLMGLEANRGNEVLQALLFDAKNKLQAMAVLSIDVGAAAMLGAYRVLELQRADDFLLADAQFTAIYGVAPAPAPGDVRAGICDTGFTDDSAGTNYLDPRWVAGRFFGSPKPQSIQAPNLDREDRPTKPDDTYPRHILLDEPSKHGTNVAGQVVWGTPKIKLVDIMVQKGQMAGDFPDSTAQRALTWGCAQNVAVINCSKHSPWSQTETNRVVTANPNVLFLATGGNTGASFPLNLATMPVDKIPGEFNGPGFLPRNFTNTVWVGGVNRDRSPRDDRGCGPAVDIVVASDEMQLYTPAAVSLAYRGQVLRIFRNDLLEFLQNLITELPEKRVPNNVKTKLSRLLEDERAGDLSDEDVIELNRIRTVDRPTWPDNPDRVRLTQGRTEIDVIAHVDIKAWMDQVVIIRDRGTTLPAVKDAIVKRANMYGADRAYADLQLVGTGVAPDLGVSFGLPIVANIASKLKLIRGDLTPSKMRRVLVDTSDLDPGLESKAMARGVVNPLRAYLAAYDNEVSEGGTDPRNQPPVTDITVVDDRRRIYYTFFYMGDDGLRLYGQIKANLKSVYRDVNIDLVEAEAPIQIPGEPMTYVAGGSISQHSWRAVVPTNHPLAKDPKHLRLILVNQCARSYSNPFSGAGLVHTFNIDNGNWRLEETGADHARASRISASGATWSCTVETKSPRIFTARTDHIVSKAIIGGLTVDSSNITVVREGDSKARITLKFATEAARRLAVEIKMELGIVQPIGGSRSGRNIFMNGTYYVGPNNPRPSGTEDANNSTLVLFLHEIGHALGMVPNTHPSYYNNQYGGEGDHCSHNTDSIANDEAVSQRVIGDGLSGRVRIPKILGKSTWKKPEVPCVMYHTRTPVHHTSLFCHTCKETLRNMNPDAWRWTSD